MDTLFDNISYPINEINEKVINKEMNIYEKYEIIQIIKI